MKKTIITFWLLVGLVSTAYSQIITISDNDTGEPLEMASLVSGVPKAFTTTNGEGQANISAFEGSEQIEIRLLGYKTIRESYSAIKASGFRVSLSRTNINLDQVVVSATRWRQSSGNIPSKITTISASEVAFQNPQTAADLLGTSGEVYIQKSQQGGGSPMIRGFATNRLLYTVDGVRMNTAIFRSGNLQNVINMDPFATEETEILFGPGTVIYGSDAIGGVMSFHTLTPQFSLSDKPLITGKAVARYSSANNEKTGHFDVNIGWKKWALVTSISSWDFDNLKQGSHGPDDYIKPIYVQRQDSTDVIITQEDPLLQIPSAYSQINMMQKVRFQPNDKWNIEYGFHFSQTSSYGRYDRNNRYKNGTLRYAEWAYGPQKWLMNNLEISYVGNNNAFDDFTLRLAQQSFEESRLDRAFNDNFRSVNTENVEAYSVNLDFKKSLGKKNEFYYGAEYIFNDIKSSGYITDISTDEDMAGPSRYPNSTWTSLAVYITDEFEVSEKFTLSAGLRYNVYAIDSDFSNNVDFFPLPFSEASSEDGSLTGSIGGVFHPGSDWAIKGNFGTAFRSPNVDDIGKVFDSEAGGVTVPNPSLEAEYAYNFDLGFAKVFGDMVKIDVTGYYTILENALVKRDFQLDGRDSIPYLGVMSKVQAVQNAAVAHVYGVEGSLEIKLPAGFSISSQINFQAGEEELDDGSTSATRHAPPMFGVTRINYRMNKVHLQLYSTYMAERSYEDLPFEEKEKVELYAKDANGNNYAPAWHTFNMKATYNFADNFTVSAGIENLADLRYRPYSSGISAPGRNFIMSLSANF